MTKTASTTTTLAARTSRTKGSPLPPEVLSIVGSFLDPPSLFSCVQVCSTWYHSHLPCLWESIDDSLYSWPLILKQKQHYEQQPFSDKEETWLRDLYIKHGHLIRNLTIHWIPTLNAAGISNTCNRLQSLILRNNLVVLSPTDETHQKQAISWPETEQVRTSEEREQPLPDEFLLLPEFKEALRPNRSWWTTDRRREQDWMTGQRFWILVLKNPGLCALGLGKCLGTLCEVQSADFLNRTLAGLHGLSYLENIYSEHFEHILTRNPALASFRSTVAFSSATLSTTFPGMQSLVVGSGLKSRDFFLILHHLPNLHNLECRTIGLFDGVFCTDADKIMEGRPSNLQRLSFQNAIRSDTPIANNVFQWLPHLKEINIRKRVHAAIAGALVLRCQELEVFREQDDTEPIHLLRPLRGQRNFLLRILQRCPRLRVFDAIHHRIDAKLLIEGPFACEDSLETFRCQVVGLERLCTDKASMNGRIMELARAGRRETAGVLTTTENMDEQLQELQINVFEQLARLTRLKILDLGHTLWNPNTAAGDYHFNQNITDGNHYVNYGEPIEGTLDLALETGLDRLSTLTQLEVFGFEGMDFKLGTPELEWMANHWPRLKVLRGLQRDDSLPRIEVDVRKAELRRFLCKLRPEVKHEGLALKMSVS